MTELGEYPKSAKKPKPTDLVQVLMPEHMAKTFETKCLGKDNTVGDTYLEGPLLFGDDDLPAYTIGVNNV